MIQNKIEFMMQKITSLSNNFSNDWPNRSKSPLMREESIAAVEKGERTGAINPCQNIFLLKTF